MKQEFTEQEMKLLREIVKQYKSNGLPNPIFSNLIIKLLSN